MSWWIGGAVGVGAVVGIVAARRRYLVVTVNGVSMRPTFADGDRVLVRRGGTRSPRRGDVVVLQTPPAEADWDTLPPLPDPARGVWIIKRIVAAPGDPLPEPAAAACGQTPGTPVPAGRFVVFGDGPVSYDSRAWGFLPAERMLGVVVRRLSSRPGNDPVATR